MCKIFLKIFLWFWAAIIMALTASVVVTVFFPTQAFIFQAKNYFAFNLATAGKLGADLYETKGAQAMEAFLGQIDTISSFRIHLISDRGHALRSAGLPQGAEEMVTRVLATPAAQFKSLSDHPLMAVRTTSDSGTHYIAMVELPVGVVRYFLTLTRGHLMRLSAALLASGLICFMFARYLTAPIKKLQAAVRRFSQGDLAVRVGPEMGKRKDEIANLAKDFDAMAAQIEKLMNAHERLLRDIAHELRSPLTRLNVALEISRRHAGPELDRFIDRIGQEADKLSQLITQLLTLSRLENAEPALQARTVALEEIIGRIAQDAGFEGQTRQCTVAFTVEQKCTLLADGNLIRSAVENVVRNALRFAPVGSQVEIVQRVLVEDHERWVQIVVKDGGPGVAETALPNLFRPFFRADHPKDRASGGAGLGLAIAHRAVAMHQGRISARNRPEGGLIVEIRLPLSPSFAGSGALPS
jgi:two-component system sensor histidine kinase CpxA